MRESVSERARIISHGITLSAAFSQLHLHHLHLHQDYHPYHHSFLFFANLSLSFLPSRNGEKFVKFSFKDCGQKIYNFSISCNRKNVAQSFVIIVRGQQLLLRHLDVLEAQTGLVGACAGTAAAAGGGGAAAGGRGSCWCMHPLGTRYCIDFQCQATRALQQLATLHGNARASFGCRIRQSHIHVACLSIVLRTRHCAVGDASRRGHSRG